MPLRVFSGKVAPRGEGRDSSAPCSHAAMITRSASAPVSRASKSSGKDQPAAPAPDLFIRGAGIYSAHLNAENPMAPCRASSTPCSPSTGLPRTNNTRCNSWENSRRLSGPPALRARGPAEGIAGAPSPAQRRARPRQERREAAEPMAEPDMESARLPTRFHSVTPVVHPHYLPAPIP